MKTKYILGLLLVFGLVFLVGCTKEGRLELESVSPTTISFSDYGIRGVPVEVTLKNVGEGSCTIKDLAMDTFWTNPDKYESTITRSKDIPKELLSGQKYTFVLRGYVPPALQYSFKPTPVRFMIDTDNNCLPDSVTAYSFDRVINFQE